MEDLTPEELFEQHLEFLPYLIRRYKRSKEYEDIEQLAMIGFYRAAKRFDASAGVLFTTYAKYYVNHEIIRNHLEKRPQLKISRLIKERSVKVKRFLSETKNPKELAELTGLTVKQVNDVLEYIAFNNEVSSLQYTLPGKDNTDGDMLGDTVYVEEDDWDELILIKDFMTTLNEREKVIFEMRLRDIPQIEIGEALNISQMHVSRLMKKMKAKFKNYVSYEEVN